MRGKTIHACTRRYEVKDDFLEPGAFAAVQAALSDCDLAKVPNGPIGLDQASNLHQTSGLILSFNEQGLEELRELASTRPTLAQVRACLLCLPHVPLPPELLPPTPPSPILSSSLLCHPHSASGDGFLRQCQAARHKRLGDSVPQSPASTTI